MSAAVTIRADVRHLGPAGLAAAQEAVTRHHYLRAPVDPRGMPEAFGVFLPWRAEPVGYLICARPEATRCYPWYGSVDDVATGRAEVTRWQVLNVARVWLWPGVQPGGAHHRPDMVPGYRDPDGRFVSRLASAALRALVARARVDYLLARPPCFPEEPYDVRWLMSYCDTRLHRGTIYAAAGWESYREGGGASGTIETWRTPVPPLPSGQRAAVLEAARRHPRSIAHRARRAQLALPI